MDTLYWYYVQSKKSKDIVGKIVKLFRDNGNKHKSRISIIQQLLQQVNIQVIHYTVILRILLRQVKILVGRDKVISTVSLSEGFKVFSHLFY